MSHWACFVPANESWEGRKASGHWLHHCQAVSYKHSIQAVCHLCPYVVVAWSVSMLGGLKEEVNETGE